MTTKIFKGALLVATTLALFSFDLPKGWFKAGSDPNKYEMGVDKGTGQDGKNSATIKSIDKKIKGFGKLMQNCSPTKFAGKRVRMTGLLKSKDLEIYAGFWLRVDASDSNKPLSFDNMYDRPIKGTTDWKKYEIVLDVPENASNIAYGVLLSGTGQVWFDSMTFEIVDNSVPTTGKTTEQRMKKYCAPTSPENLNFEE
jgi:hypothetical protein